MTNPEPSWLDQGPVSQGKILTAILQRHHDHALTLLRSWSDSDLRALEEAATRLARMAGRELRERRRFSL